MSLMCAHASIALIIFFFSFPQMLAKIKADNAKREMGGGIAPASAAPSAVASAAAPSSQRTPAHESMPVSQETGSAAEKTVT